MPGITNPAEEYFKDGTWGWDGSVWRKLPLLWGYSDRWFQYVYGTATDAGDATANTTPVVEGYVYVLQRVSVSHDAGANKKVFVALHTAADYAVVFWDPAVVSGAWHVIQCDAVLKYQDFVRAVCEGPGNGKHVLLRVWGYKMKIAE